MPVATKSSRLEQLHKINARLVAFLATEVRDREGVAIEHIEAAIEHLSHAKSRLEMTDLKQD